MQRVFWSVALLVFCCGVLGGCWNTDTFLPGMTPAKTDDKAKPASTPAPGGDKSDRFVTLAVDAIDAPTPAPDATPAEAAPGEAAPATTPPGQ